VNLANIGIQASDVQELIFWCTSQHKIDGLFPYIYFKTRDPDVLKVALSGDQVYLKPKSWKNGVTPLDPEEKYEHGPYKKMKPYMNCEETPSSKEGGFWNIPFRDQQGGWEIRGPGRVGKWTCGDTVEEINGSNYETEHRIWFRGPPPSDEVHEKRHLAQNSKIAAGARR